MKNNTAYPFKFITEAAVVVTLIQTETFKYLYTNATKSTLMQHVSETNCHLQFASKLISSIFLQPIKHASWGSSCNGRETTIHTLLIIYKACNLKRTSLHWSHRLVLSVTLLGPYTHGYPWNWNTWKITFFMQWWNKSFSLEWFSIYKDALPQKHTVDPCYIFPTIHEQKNLMFKKHW